jgi:hypothetical protein
MRRSGVGLLGTTRNVGDVIPPAWCGRWILMFVGDSADEIPDWWESVPR